MKKLLLSLTVFVMLGCSGRVYLQRTFIGDFREYSEAGFVISPSFTGFTYEPIGLIEMEFSSGEKKDYKAATNKEQPVVLFGQTAPIGDVFFPTYDYVVSELVLEAKKLGANGILGLKIESKVTWKNKSKIVEYKASGFGVKIKDNSK